MSLWEDAVHFVQSTYADSTAAYLDLRNYLPGTLFIDGAPIPLTSTLDAMFLPGGPRRSVVEAYLVIFGGAHIGDTATGHLLNLQASGTIQGRSTAMGTLIIPGAFQVTINGLAGGRAVDNVFGCVNASGTALGAANAVGTAWATRFMGQLTSDYLFVDATAVDIGTAMGAVATVPHNLPGALSGSISTRAASALVQWGGGTRSRTGRGRTYVGPLMEGQIDPDGASLASGTLTAFGTAAAAFLTDLATAGYPMAVLSRVASTATIITASALSPTIGTQRRRIRS